MPQFSAAFFLLSGNKKAELAQGWAHQFTAHWPALLTSRVNPMPALRCFRRLLFASLAACPLLALADPVYTMRLLPRDFEATALNDKGHVAGAVDGEVSIWSDSGLVNLSVRQHPWGSVDVNNRGDVAASLFAGTQTGAAVYSSGMWHYINPLVPERFAYSAAYAINDSGAVAGAAHVEIGDEGSAFIYKDGQFEFIGTLGGYWSEPRAISNSGHVAGWSHIFVPGGSFYNHHAFLYKDGALQDLGTLGGYLSAATAVNNAGQVVGWANTTFEDHVAHPFLFAHGRMIDLGTLGGDYGSANGINNAGVVVGESATANGPRAHAFVYKGDKMIDLNTLVEGLDGRELVTAQAINDAHQILAKACLPRSCQWVLLTPRHPVPNPGAAAGEPDQD